VRESSVVFSVNSVILEFCACAICDCSNVSNLSKSWARPVHLCCKAVTLSLYESRSARHNFSRSADSIIELEVVEGTPLEPCMLCRTPSSLYMFFLVQFKAGAIGIRVHSTKNSVLKCVGCEPQWIVGRGPSICLDCTPVSASPDGRISSDLQVPPVDAHNGPCRPPSPLDGIRGRSDQAKRRVAVCRLWCASLCRH
jgi:hypothetical protein